ncbi:MAG: Chromosome-partitioning protein Spo0J [Deltaproteobacteria bacterium ADurb.Bin135]|nr:MAG: Chromosome-partitioning protein Spo0J [Deltaproteobacteria bacterium ADurb.Bin135]
MTEQEKAASPEFMYLPLENIIVEGQIRSGIDTEGESFKALMKSIKDRGILEPVLVTPKDSKYLLLCGERRFLAAQKLGLPTIPARIVNTITQKDEILAFQLTENLQREDLNPIDQAKGILAYIQAKHPDKGYELDGVMSELVKYEMKPESLSKEIVDTVSTISQISAKSTRTLLRTISLLKLFPEIQAAIRAGTLPVSQGYLFAANLDCPDLMKIFTDTMKTPVTNATLERMLTAYKKVKKGLSGMKPKPLTKQYASLRSMKTIIQKGAGKYAKTDLEKLLDQLRTLCTMVEEQVQAVSPADPVNPPQI